MTDDFLLLACFFESLQYNLIRNIMYIQTKLIKRFAIPKNIYFQEVFVKKGVGVNRFPQLRFNEAGESPDSVYYLEIYKIFSFVKSSYSSKTIS